MKERFELLAVSRPEATIEVSAHDFENNDIVDAGMPAFLPAPVSWISCEGGDAAEPVGHCARDFVVKSFRKLHPSEPARGSKNSTRCISGLDFGRAPLPNTNWIRVRVLFLRLRI